MRNISYQENFPVKKTFLRMAFAILLLAVALIFLSGLKTPSYGATVKTIPPDMTSNIANKENRLSIGLSTVHTSWNIGTRKHKLAVAEDHENKTTSDTAKVYCIKLTDKEKSNGFTLKNDPITFAFKDVGTIDGRKINCTVTVNSITFGGRFYKNPNAEENKDGYVGICRMDTKNLEFGTTLNGGHGLHCYKTIKYTVKMTYADNDSPINLPFFQAVRDLDYNNTKYNYSEGWEAGDGYESVFYKYPGNTCTFKENAVYANGPVVDGTNSMTKAGIYVNTTKGTFSGTFYEGNCGTELELYSQYNNSTSNLELPTLAVDKETAKPKDTITYTVSQKIGTFYSTVLKPYDKIVFTDVVPNEVTYKSAKMLDGNGNDITNQGTLSYDNGTRTVKFVMGDTWRNKESNYNGQTLKLVISTTANRFKGSKITITNQAKVSLADAVTNDTNTVKTKMIQPDLNDKTDYIQLQIRISKDKDQQTEAHGKPTFIFKVTGKGSGKTYYDSVTFGNPDESFGWTFKEDGDWIVATGMKTKVPEDVYTADYVQVSRFKVTAEPPMVMDAENEDSYILFPFEATKKTWQYYSHNNIVINQLMKK